MTTTHTDTTPYWTTTATFPRFAKLAEDAQVDVIVVGGGITGLTAAYLLSKAGQSVILLERERCALTDTGHTSAHLTMVTDARLSELATRFGRTHAQAVWDAGLAGMAQIAQIVDDEDIAAGFEWVDGYLHAPIGDNSPEQAAALEKEATLARELGFDAKYLDDVPIAGTPGVLIERQARIHPRHYLAGVAKAIAAAGGRIFEHSEAAEFCDEPLAVKANGHTVRCRKIVIATHNPLVGVGGTAGATLFQTKLALYTSYVVGCKVAKGQAPDALWWDTGDPYHYLRVEPHHDHDLLIFGGEDHKTGQEGDTEACYGRLEQHLARLFPGAKPAYRWSGQVIETPDGLPYIGLSAEHQYSATGYSGNGLTFGTVAGMMVTDAILGRPNPWTELFDPGRKAVTRGLWEYIKENADYPYYMIRDRFAGADSRSLRSVKRGEGKIVERDGKKVAAYRNRSGALTLKSAICPHMGCVVGWNPAEQTWDCPCHGSRFKPTGDVISGPAEAPLSDAE